MAKFQFGTSFKMNGKKSYCAQIVLQRKEVVQLIGNIVCTRRNHFVHDLASSPYRK